MKLILLIAFNFNLYIFGFRIPLQKFLSNYKTRRICIIWFVFNYLQHEKCLLCKNFFSLICGLNFSFCRVHFKLNLSSVVRANATDSVKHVFLANLLNWIWHLIALILIHGKCVLLHLAFSDIVYVKHFHILPLESGCGKFLVVTHAKYH